MREAGIDGVGMVARECVCALSLFYRLCWSRLSARHSIVSEQPSKLSCDCSRVSEQSGGPDEAWVLQ